MTEKGFFYELPENWRWTTLENVAEIIMGQSPSGTETTSDSSYTPLIGGAADMGDLFPRIKRYTKKPTKLSKTDDIIISVRATLGNPIFSDKEYCLGRGVAAVRLSSDSKDFFRYVFINFRQYFFDNATGSTFLQISSERLKKFPIPLPPLDEQKKIVERIESLFSKLDSAKSIVQKILDGYELRRTAILHKAFIGELSKNFRAENNLSLDDWENLPLPCVFSIKSGATLPIEEEKSTGKIPYVKVSDMNIKENSVQIITSSKFVDNCRQANIIPEGSVIFPKRGGAIFTNKKRYVGVEKIVADLNIMALIPNCNKIFSWYGYYWMLSVDLKEICNGSNIHQINHKDMIKLFLSLPPLAEQKEIVRVLDSLLDKEQRTKDFAEKILSDIDLMKKSVLARAFRGEL